MRPEWGKSGLFRAGGERTCEGRYVVGHGQVRESLLPEVT